MTDVVNPSQRHVDGLPPAQLVHALQLSVLGSADPQSPQVIWTDRGSQIMLDVASIQAHLSGNVLVVAVDTHTVEFGTAPLIVRFVFGDGKDAATLVAVTDDTAHGEPHVAARWGSLFRDVVWAAIVRLSVSSANGRSLTPAGLALQDNQLQFIAEPAVSVPDLARQHIDALRAGVTPS